MRVSTVTLWTLTALALGDLTQKAIATPVSPDPSPNPEDLTALPEVLSTEVVITSIAPAESIVVEPFTGAKVPESFAEAGVDAAIQPVFSDISGMAIIPAQAEPSIAEATLIPVVGLVTVNTPPESTSIPERRTEPRIPFEAILPSIPDPVTDPVTEHIAQVTPNEPSPAAPTPAEADPTDSEIEELQRQLNAVPTLEPDFGNEFGGSPAITISNPSGRGADRFTAFFNTSFQADKRGEDGADGSLGVGIGLGDAQRAVGLQLSYTLASFGTLGRDFGTGGFNAKLHRQFPNGLSAALGWEGFATIGDVDFEDTVYGSVTQLIRTTPSIDKPLSRIALTAGVGNGRFRSEDDFNNDVDSVNVFGSAAVRIARPLSVIVEWTGQDLAAGLSIAPIRNFPLVITPALRDITGAGNGARFVIGTGVSFQF